MAEGAADFLAGGGEMGALMRARDWRGSPLGPPSGWPQSLRTAVSILLNSRYPMFVFWGPSLVKIYNDGYRPILGAKHPWALGRPGPEVWPEIWDTIGPMVERVVVHGEATFSDDLMLVMHRHGYPEEVYFTFSYSPIRDESGGVGGMFCACTETTGKVIGERRLECLRELAAAGAEARSLEEAGRRSMAVLAGSGADIPFALLYRLEDEGRAQLAAAAGIEAGAPAAPLVVEAARQVWPLLEAAEGGRGLPVGDLASRFEKLSAGPWPEPPPSAMVLPLTDPAQGRACGLLVLGVSARRAFDADYEGFFGLVAGQIATSLGNARASEEERRRAEALAELDRAKTLFFSNVSHEFRTPLTLMLGPLEEALEGPAEALPARRGELLVAHRNGLRLLRMVNTLLDFSRVEAGRVRASFEPVDLAALTAELASNFRSACERAGLSLEVDCPALGEPVWVDREMWEKIVLNLLSNAFKFTLEGGIAVRLRTAGRQAELLVADTGVGIPEAELPRLFERFHRIEGQRGRSFEGTGIGLALVRELVRLHGGEIEVRSRQGEGSSFTLHLPLGSAHLPAGQLQAQPADGRTGARARAFVEEALRWLPGEGEALGSLAREAGAGEPPAGSGVLPRLLLADDNADMRDYVRRLLAGPCEVLTAADGREALELARRHPPDLVLSDVMMPGLDGLGLLAALRADPATRELPVILLSARAGEEPRIEGLEAGADDYLTKPFTARDLLARVRAHLRLAGLRREAVAEVRAREERLRLIFDSATEYAIIALDREGRVTDWNSGAERLLGWQEEKILGRPGDLLFTPEDRAAGVPGKEMRRALAEGAAADERWHVRRDGSRFWASGRLMRLGDGGTPAGFLKILRDRTVERLAEQALRESEERFRNIADHTPAMIWVSEPDGSCTYINRRWGDFTGQPFAESMGLGWLDCVHPEDRPTAEAVFLAANAQSRDFEIRYRLRRHDGVWRWVSDTAAPRFAADGVFLGYVGSVLDIDERRRWEEKQTLLLGELSHRVKNSLAVVQALARQSAAGAAGIEAYLEAFDGRLQALAAAHDLLSATAWQGAALRDLLERVLGPHQGKAERLVLEGADRILPPALAQDLALGFHELATNAAKYGALSRQEGRIGVRVSEEEGGLLLLWQESGGPPVARPERRGFGTRLLTRAVAHQHGGRVELDWRQDGLVCRISVPLRALMLPEACPPPRSRPPALPAGPAPRNPDDPLPAGPGAPPPRR
ncbi:PAS domain S-box protein [Geminicoccaceae bacterium 1502E]|nr:PAS domain S-box protein [Geminicoccaceae bacterium 1502E]